MNAQQIALVQHSFAQVRASSDTLPTLFYPRLFELDPSLRALFVSDMLEQGRKLVQMLSVVVVSLDRIETLIPAVEALGRRHVDYGVREEHYATVGAALLWTLEQMLGGEFSPEVAAAWAAAYELLAATMVRAAATPQPAEV